ncbi:MAG: hypothetical protein ACKE9I_01205 [Methylophagaceae bacterium]
MVEYHRYLLLFMGLSLNVYANERIPDEDLLEFLADWEAEDGQWLDPEQLLQMPELTINEEVQDEN